jgi:GT2 family glycosyltransferase
METIAPPIVAVIVTCDPGEWFEETLRAFASQDYPELSILVLDAASAVDPTPRVAAVLPGAFVRRLPTNRGFGATANEALAMVEGASLLLFCHDDVAPDPDAIHILVEESFRSNAGIVTPKLVTWDDPTRLLHVGMAVDKGGAVVDRVEPGEIDHGQHDAVRDVFLAPGGCTLVRADLFAELGGFDPEIFAMGEDLDLCWRAQIFGARVVVAPGARVRHLEVLASGRRVLPGHVLVQARRRGSASSAGVGADEVPTETGGGDASATGADTATPTDAEHRAGGPAGIGAGTAAERTATVAAAGVGTALAGEAGADRSGIGGARRRRGSGRGAHGRVTRVTLQSLQRRHELHAALKAYGPFHLVRVMPQVALLNLAEAVIAVVARHRDRASAVAHAWRWNLSRRRALRAARAVVAAHRRLEDTEVRLLQLHGSARLNAYVRRAVTHGLQAANIGGAEQDHQMSAIAALAVPESVRTASSEATPGFDEGPATSTRWLVYLAAALVVVVGTRQLFGSGFPVVGQLLPMPTWTTLVHRFVSGWQPTGVGTTDPATPATGILGLSGMVLFGSVGVLEKIVVLGCIPVGAVGMARLTRPLGTAWARVTSTIIYLAIPVPYDALATARWDGLIMYAACPWILHLLGQASRVEPYGEPTLVDASEALAAPRPNRAWRQTLVGWSLALGLLDAFITSMAPSTALVILIVAVGLALGNVVARGNAGLRAAGRVVVVALGATAVAVVLLAPWSFAVLGGPRRWQTLAGLPVAPSTSEGWGSLLRLAVGPIGDAALAWAFLAAAALPLLIGARSRLAWAGRAWSVAVVAWVVAWLAGRGWLGPIAIPPQVLLVPAGVGIALAVGLGVAAFQLDLPGYRFGWRQAAAVTAAAAAAVGMLPVLGGSLGGRWDLVPSGYAEATTWMSAQGAAGDFRVLWLGDPRVLPGTGWELAPGLAYAVSENGLPDVTGLWPGSSPGKAAAIGNGVQLARDHATVRLGRLLAPYAVRYVVVVDTLAPSIPGLQTPIAHAPPGDLLGALAAQVDLRQVISQGGFDVFADAAAVPERALRSAASEPSSPTSAVTGAAPGLTGWQPVLPGPAGATSITGRVGAGTVLAAVAPASAWQLTVGGGAVEHASSSFGYAATFPVSRPGTVTVAFTGSPGHGIEVGVESAAWIVVAAALAGRRRWLDWWLGPLSGRRGGRRRRRGTAAPGTVVSDPPPVASPGAREADRPATLVSGAPGAMTGTTESPGDAR